MAPELETAQTVPGVDAPPLDPIRTEDDHLLRDYVESIRNALGEENADELRVLTDQLYVSEVAELLTILSEEERPKLIELIGENFDFAALTEVDEQIRIDVLDALPLHLIAAGFVELESDDAVYILEDLPENAQAEILRTIPTLDRLAPAKGPRLPRGIGRSAHAVQLHRRATVLDGRSSDRLYARGKRPA
jgi:magnesium transporter